VQRNERRAGVKGSKGVYGTLSEQQKHEKEGKGERWESGEAR